MAKRKRDEDYEWLHGTRHKKPKRGLCNEFAQSFAAAFRKQYAMDFYITKYQGKQMEALTPLFQGMLNGVHRFEAQVRAEKELAEEAAAAYAASACEAEPPTKNR